LNLQRHLLIPVACYCLGGLFIYFKRYSFKQALKQVWDRTPAYLLFVLVMMLLLSLSGFLAFYLVKTNTGTIAQSFELVPLYMLILSSLSILINVTFLKSSIPLSSYTQRLQARQEKSANVINP